MCLITINLCAHTYCLHGIGLRNCIVNELTLTLTQNTGNWAWWGEVKGHSGRGVYFLAHPHLQSLHPEMRFMAATLLHISHKCLHSCIMGTVNGVLHRFTTLCILQNYNGCLWLSNVNYYERESEHAHLWWTYIQTDKIRVSRTSVGFVPRIYLGVIENLHSQITS